MLAVRAIYHQGSLEWLESPPPNARGMVVVVFLETDQTQSEQAREAALLAASPTFQRLVEHGMAYVAAGETRSMQALLDELPD